MRSRSIAAVWVFLGALVAATAAWSATTLPNIVFIHSDDHGWADVGYRNSVIDTPNIDSLAAEGLTLERYHTYPICGPTRVGLMTGRSPVRLSLTGNIVEGEEGIPLDERLLPETFQAVGYQTWMMGKWHLGGTTGEEYLPQNRGFDHFYGFVGGSIDETTHMSGGELDWQRNGVDIPEDDGLRSTDLMADEAISLVENRNHESPFFLYLSFHALHTPYDAPQELKDKYAALGLTGLALNYAAMAENMDMQIGRILAKLESEGLDGDTLVVFASDNGAQQDRGGSNAPLRGWKNTVFEGGHRVPAVLRWPGRLEPGTTSTQFVSHQDWFPTLTAAAGLVPFTDKALDGIDRWGALQSEEEGRPRGFVIERGRSTAVLDGDWKILRETRTAEFQLYDVYADPAETTDLAADRPEIVTELSIYLDLIETCGDGVLDANEECDDGDANNTLSSCCDRFCQFEADGTFCSDRQACTRPDACSSGVCEPGPCASGSSCSLCGGTCSDAGGCHCE